MTRVIAAIRCEVGGTAYNPGDAFEVPDEQVSFLLAQGAVVVTSVAKSAPPGEVERPMPEEATPATLPPPVSAPKRLGALLGKTVKRKR